MARGIWQRRREFESDMLGDDKIWGVLCYWCEKKEENIEVNKMAPRQQHTEV